MARITHKHTTSQGQREGLGAGPLAAPPDPRVHFVTFSCCSSIPPRAQESQSVPSALDSQLLLTLLVTSSYLVLFCFHH